MTEETTMIVRPQQPKRIVNFAQKSALQLVDLVKQNNWSINIQGNDYLKFEAWQTVGNFFGYTIKTKSTEYVEYGDARGFNATCEVLDRNGQVIGGAESVCLSDEKNWKDKPLYALKSMAQTRAAGRALRQILAWVVVLAGYKPTPAEEMTDITLYPKAPESRNIQPYNLVCAMDDCQKVISQKVASWSKEKYGIELCYDCQKKSDDISEQDGELISETVAEA